MRNKLCNTIQDIKQVLKELRGLAEEATITFAVGYGLYLFIAKVLMG
jgi:chaperonin cofactor prefoldin